MQLIPGLHDIICYMSATIGTHSKRVPINLATVTQKLTRWRDSSAKFKSHVRHALSLLLETSRIEDPSNSDVEASSACHLQEDSYVRVRMIEFLLGNVDLFFGLVALYRITT